jgi:hypothetical protein
MSWIITGTQKNKGLLDEFTGAAAAYSLRDLTFLRGNPVVRVRRSSDNAEQDFTAAEVSDGTLAAWVGAGNNGFVRTWYDQSGNARHATQTTTANQPQIVNSGSVLLQNSKPTLSFDGTNDTMAIPLNVAGANTLSVYFVNTYFSGSPYAPDIGVLSSNGSDNGALHYVKSNLSGASYPFYYNFGDYDGIGTYSAGTMYSIAVEFPGTSPWSIFKNGTYEGGSATYGTFNSTQVGFTIAHQQNVPRYMQSNFSEAIFYTSDQSANRTGIEANINAHYSIF